MATAQKSPTEKSTVLTSVLWTERHRPKELAAVGLDQEARATLEAFLEAGEIPHLLFVGPPGVGKTTLARILLSRLNCSVLSLNASVERGIDVVRQKIGLFATAMTSAKFNVVFLDEGDKMTPDAQTGLRNLMESYAERTRFIITANAGHGIIGPIHSRCQVFVLSTPPMKERYRILVDVLQKEGVTIPSPQVVLGYVEKFSDMRQMLFAAQRAVLGSGGKILPAASGTTGTTGTEMLTLVEQKNWAAIRRIVSSGDFDPSAGLRDLFWAVQDNHPRVGFLRHSIGKAVHDSGYTPDMVVLFLGTVAGIMEAL